MEILIGCDPEVFARTDKGFVSVHDILPGTKANPYKVAGGAVQVDGLAAEFNIDPASTEEEFVTRVNGVLDILRGMVPNAELIANPTADFDPEYMAALPAGVLELGCDPDFDAWNGGKPNPRPNGTVNFRTGSGHVHIGWTKDQDINDPEHREACLMAAQQMDFYLGLPSKLFDKDNRRARLYGNWGAFRVKPYGVEYRTLSNAWLNSPKLISWVYNNAKKGIEDLLEGKHPPKLGYSKINLDYTTSYGAREIKNVCIYNNIALPPGF